ncbi:hypothetical protein ElyMa_004425500 [Elysia marginata]|uniref:Uncharacterized protein n=1 Tax=Elysia marginata TaxID=1093978 RepID=A0AAV4HEZ9_9GAST|nr:hypothetical protein ElyMa_004425500 [Elysia marginata]
MMMMMMNSLYPLQCRTVGLSPVLQCQKLNRDDNDDDDGDDDHADDDDDDDDDEIENGDAAATDDDNDDDRDEDDSGADAEIISQDKLGRCRKRKETNKTNNPEASCGDLIKMARFIFAGLGNLVGFSGVTPSPS